MTFWDWAFVLVVSWYAAVCGRDCAGEHAARHLDSDPVMVESQVVDCHAHPCATGKVCCGLNKCCDEKKVASNGVGACA